MPIVAWKTPAIGSYAAPVSSLPLELPDEFPAAVSKGIAAIV